MRILAFSLAYSDMEKVLFFVQCYLIYLNFCCLHYNFKKPGRRWRFCIWSGVSNFLHVSGSGARWKLVEGCFVLTLWLCELEHIPCLITISCLPNNVFLRNRRSILMRLRKNPLWWFSYNKRILSNDLNKAVEIFLRCRRTKPRHNPLSSETSVMFSRSL